jgi:hypothetical protein
VIKPRRIRCGRYVASMGKIINKYKLLIRENGGTRPVEGKSGDGKNIKYILKNGVNLLERFQ